MSSSQQRILIVDDDPVVLRSLKDLLTIRGYNTDSAIGGQEVSDARTLLQAITAHQAGQTVEVTYYRGESENTVAVTLAESPPPEFG